MMQDSASEHSYALSSDTQNVGFHLAAKPHLSQAIKHLVCSSFLTTEVPATQRRHTVAIADLGCAHGRNTLDCAEFVVLTLQENLASSAHSILHNVKLDIQYFFSDLPSNDFNALFQSLMKPCSHRPDVGAFADALPKFFAAGVPGSFYDRLFPTASLDLVICSYSLHWLSQVPPALVDKTSPAWNGGHIWISRFTPSKPVIDAYARQSEADLKRFLRHRAHELSRGGILFLFLIAIDFTEASQSICVSDFCDLLEWAWKEMVNEGLIAPESMDTFNIPWYFVEQGELERVLKDVPEFRVLQVETITEMAYFRQQGDRPQTVERFVGFVSSIVRPSVEAHLGQSNADELFKKFRTICLKHECFDVPLRQSAIAASLQRFAYC